MKMPRHHIADETLARIAVAAKRTRRRPAPETNVDELPPLPPLLMPGKPLELGQPAPSSPAIAAESVPPLAESGLDAGMVLHGADSFDAALEG